MNVRTLALSLVLLPLAPGCACGELVFFDPFTPSAGPSTEQPESLHVYASDAVVPMSVRSTDGSVELESLTITTSGELEIDGATEPLVANGVLSFVLNTKAAGSGTVALVDESGTTRAERELSVVDVDELSLSVTAPTQEGIQLPSVDPGKLRIFTGGNAGLRTTLLYEGEEVFGTHAVEVSSSDEEVSGRRARACSRQGCSAPRSAVVLSLGASATDDTQVTLSAGSASLTLTVVPTAEAALTSLKTSGPVANPDSEEQRVLSALPQVDGEPVFGAPVVWAVDGEELEERGDLLRFLAEEGSASVTASLGGLSEPFTLDVAVTEPSVTSVTAVCGQALGGGSAAAPVLALLSLLGLARARRAGRS